MKPLVVAAALLTALAGCAKKVPPPPDPPPETPAVERVTIRGSLTFDAALGLPASAVAVVAAKDAATGRTVSAARTPLRGQQVPIPFALTLRPQQGPVVVHATIEDGGAVAWQIVPVRVERPATSPDLGALTLARAEAAPAQRLRCGDHDVALRIFGEAATVTIGGRTRRLTRPTADAPFTGEGITLARDGDAYVLTLDGVAATCAPAD